MYDHKAIEFIMSDQIQYERISSQSSMFDDSIFWSNIKPIRSWLIDFSAAFSNCSGRRIVVVVRGSKVRMDTRSVVGILRMRTAVSADIL
jgi:hypothetical protein